MANEYYDHTTYPSTGAAGSSSAMRAELNTIEAGFDKLPTMTGNGGEIVAVNSGATALEAITTTGTGSGVRATSPTLVTPVLQNSVLTATRYIAQGAFATHAGAATMLPADILDGLVRYTGAADSLTLPTGADLAAAANAVLSANRAFDFSVMNTGSGTVTIANGASGWGVAIGAVTVAAGSSGLFRVRCTGAATYALYRIA